MGIIGLISQLGYLVAYLSIGLLAESVFEPLLNYPNQHLVFIQRILGVGEGTGIAFMIVIGGICLFILALLISKEKSIYQ